MKSVTTAISFVAMIATFGLNASAAPGPLKMDVLECQTPPNEFHGFTALTLKPKGGNVFELSGTVSGGIAQFIRLITPIEVTAKYDVDMVTYQNQAQGVTLNVITTNIGGHLLQSASYQEGKEFPAESMNCHMSTL